MTSKEWALLFQDNIRTAVDVVSAKKEKWNVEMVVLTRIMHDSVQLPWWHDVWMMPQDWPSGGERFTIKGAYDNLASLGWDRRKLILDLVRSFESRPSPMILPAVRMGPSKTMKEIMLVDGCHRAIATRMTTHDPVITMAVLDVPHGHQWDMTVGT